MLSVVMYAFKVSVSLFCGYPKSMISIRVSISITRTFLKNVITVNELIDQNKVTLHRLFINLAEVCLGNRDETIAKLENQRGISVVSRRVSSCFDG